MKSLLQKTSIVLAVVAGVCVSVQAKVVGQNTPALSLTAERVKATLPVAQQAAWLAYLDRSAKQEAADRAAFAAEMKVAGVKEPWMPKEGFSSRTMPLDLVAAWYGSDEALKVADVIVSFQIPNGGWSKNLDMRQPTRVPGENYTADNLSKYPDADDFDAPRDPHWNYVGTLDNDATNTELKFLRLVIAALPAEKSAAYRASYLRGIEYLLAAQYPNGGWPQVWTLEGGYHDAITFNDDAVTESLEVLEPVAEGKVSFVPKDTRKLAQHAFARGVQCILATQIVLDKKKTVWGQQHDALTLQPVAGRNFEMPAMSSGESASVLLFLMQLPKPSRAVIAAVDAGAAWFKETAVYGYEWGYAWGGTRAEGRHLTKAPNAGPIWARYYSITTEMPVFGDRDKTIHDDVSELSLERQNGYAWYNSDGAEMLTKYAVWARKVHPAGPSNSQSPILTPQEPRIQMATPQFPGM